MRIPFAILLLMLPPGAQAAPLAGISTCTRVQGFSADTDPKGTNLRAGPDANAPIVGHLPPRLYEKQADLYLSAEFDVIGSKTGWLQIANASDGHVGQDSTYTFKGSAWISGTLVGFTVGSTKLHAAPSLTSPAVATLLGGNFGPDSYDVKRVHACSGSFVDITVQLPPAMKKDAKPVCGWAAVVCSNRLTTCDAGSEN
jgi:hypothetical protein